MNKYININININPGGFTIWGGVILYLRLHNPPPTPKLTPPGLYDIPAIPEEVFRNCFFPDVLSHQIRRLLQP